MAIDKWVHLKNAALEPDDVCKLLNDCAEADRLKCPIIPVSAATLRELVVTWLRVAAKFEEIELRPHLYDRELRELVALMLLGEPLEKTEPNCEAPTPPMLKCVCGYHGPALPFPSDTDRPDHHCPQCGEDIEWRP